MSQTPDLGQHALILPPVTASPPRNREHAQSQLLGHRGSDTGRSLCSTEAGILVQVASRAVRPRTQLGAIGQGPTLGHSGRFAAGGRAATLLAAGIPGARKRRIGVSGPRRRRTLRPPASTWPAGASVTLTCHIAVTNTDDAHGPQRPHPRKRRRSGPRGRQKTVPPTCAMSCRSCSVGGLPWWVPPLPGWLCLPLRREVHRELHARLPQRRGVSPGHTTRASLSRTPAPLPTPQP